MSNDRHVLLRHLLGLLAATRRRTLSIVRGLSQTALDYRPHEDMNSIGVLLRHIACIERIYYLKLFEKRDFWAEEVSLWRGSFSWDMAEKLVDGHGLEYYERLMGQVRAELLSALEAQDDGWLNEKGVGWASRKTNGAHIFHVIEDEISHSGQMKVIKKFINKRIDG